MNPRWLSWDNTVPTKIAFMCWVSCFPWKPLAENHHLFPTRPSFPSTHPAPYLKRLCLMTHDITTKHFQSIGFCREWINRTFLWPPLFWKGSSPAHWNMLQNQELSSSFSVFLFFLPSFFFQDQTQIGGLAPSQDSILSGLVLILLWIHPLRHVEDLNTLGDNWQMCFLSYSFYLIILHDLHAGIPLTS